jgi:hypothetical protein
MLTNPTPAPVRQERFQDLRRRFHTKNVSVSEGAASTSIRELDELLKGGLPTGSLVTLEGPMGSGRWSIAAGVLADATRRGIGAVLDAGELYPPALAAAGVRLDRLMVVPAKTALGIARAVDILLRSRAARVVVMNGITLRAAVWARFAHLAHRCGIVLLVITARAAGELAAHAALRLGCALERVMLCGTRGLWCTFAGFSFCARVQKHKLTAPGTSTQINVAYDTAGMPLTSVDVYGGSNDVAVRACP